MSNGPRFEAAEERQRQRVLEARLCLTAGRAGGSKDKTTTMTNATYGGVRKHESRRGRRKVNWGTFMTPARATKHGGSTGLCTGNGIVTLCVQGSAKRRSPGLVNSVAAVAYHFCLALPAAFTQPGDHLLADPCTYFSER